MSWREEYLQGSFRGAKFHVEVIESGFSRRQVEHEYPAQDRTYVEDLGRASDEFTVEAYVIGPNYKAEREALVAACRDTAGPGTLVHPYRGELEVVCRGLRVRESSDKGGMAVLAITFLEAGAAVLPTVIVDTIGAVTAAAAEVKAASRASFLSKFRTAGFPQYVLDAATAQVTRFANFFNTTVLGPIDAATAEANELARDLKAIKDDAEAIATDAQRAADEVGASIDKVRQVYAKGASALAKLFDANSARSTADRSTASGEQEAENWEALAALIRQAAIAEAATDAIETDFPSYEDAIASRDLLLDRIDADAEIADDDNVYMAMMALRAEIARGIPDPAAKLPRIVSYAPPQTTPSLVLAYRLYGDAGRADEIVARNALRHPGFIVGGRALEVLSDAG